MHQKNSVINIQLKDIATVAQVLSDAFEHDPLMRWIMPDPNEYKTKSNAFFSAIISYSIRYGKAWRTSNFESIALRRIPGDRKFSFWRLLRSGMLKCPSILGKAGFERIEALEKLTDEEKITHMGKTPFWYCWHLATQPEHQGQGFGRILMQHTFNLATADHLPCYLETASERSLAVHESQGYKILSQRSLPDSSVVITSMLREAKH